MKLLFKLLLSILLLVFLPAFFSAFVIEISKIVKDYRAFQWFLIGLAGYVPIHFLLVRHWYGLATFVHESIHAIFSLLFLRRVTMFVVTSKNGGAVGHTHGFGGRFGDTAISLAPYFFPLFAVVLALLRPLFLKTGQPYFDIVLGATLGFHLLTAFADTLKSFKERKLIGLDGSAMKSDVGKWGIFYSALVISFFWVFFHGILLALVGGGYDQTWLFVKAGALGGIETGQRAADWIFQAIQTKIAMM